MALPVIKTNRYLAIHNDSKERSIPQGMDLELAVTDSAVNRIAHAGTAES
ncbi:hypothetical protein [Paenibacillus sp. FSL K6-2859]